MEKWPIGVFASIDAGLGVKLEVAHELGVPTIQLHAPHRASPHARERAGEFLGRLGDAGIRITAVFGGFEGESYADIPTVSAHRGPGAAGNACRTRDAGDEGDRRFRPPARRRRGGACTWGSCRTIASDPLYGEVLAVTRDCATTAAGNGQALAPGNRPGAGRRAAAIHRRRRARQPVHQLRSGEHDPLRLGRADRGPGEGRSLTCGACTARMAPGPRNPGQEWGTEVPLGEGDVGMENVPANARQDRLPRPVDHRARDSARSRAAKGRDRQGIGATQRAEAEDRLGDWLSQSHCDAFFLLVRPETGSWSPAAALANARHARPQQPEDGQHGDRQQDELRRSMTRHIATTPVKTSQRRQVAVGLQNHKMPITRPTAQAGGRERGVRFRANRARPPAG